MPPVIPNVSSELLTPLLTAGGILLVATFLGLWQWFDRRARDPNLDDGDLFFFRQQDSRRWVGIAVMAMLALAIALEPFASSAIPESTKPVWQLTVLSILIGLILTLIGLALADAMATRRYIRRHRRELVDEHGKLMLEVIRRASAADAMPRHRRRRTTLRKSESRSPRHVRGAGAHAERGGRF